MKRTLKWAMSAALLAGSVCGQEEPREITLSLDECVKSARDRSTRVLQGKLARDLRDADVDASRANFLPTVSTNWSSSNTVNGPRNASFIDEATGALVLSLIHI